MVNGSARGVVWVAGVVRWFQTGYIYHYAFGMLMGVILLMSYFVSWPMLVEWLKR
jgi:NADH-quinone oxidoreductase subunit L